jgi:site-specific DNA-methyltransferase (adenine-specific)
MVADGHKGSSAARHEPDCPQATTRERVNMANDEWETPQDFFDKLDAIFHFTMDIAASEANAKCPIYFDKEFDSLHALGWSENQVIWLNPPYSKPYPWVKKAWEEAEYNTIVLLLPSTTGVKWFHEFVWDDETGRSKDNVLLYFIPGRIKFVGAKSTPRFDSVLVVFKRRHYD